MFVSWWCPMKRWIIWRALNYIPPRQQAATIIIEVNGEDRVIIMRFYPVKILIHRVSQHQGEDLSSPVGEGHDISVDDVVITTRKRKRSVGDNNYWSNETEVLYRHEVNDNKSRREATMQEASHPGKE